MALTNLVTSLVLDVYDHDTTPTSVKAIALDKQTRFIKATLTYRGADYPVDENATVTLTVIRPDKTGVQVTGSVVDVDNADRTGTIKGVSAELSQTALAVKGNLKAQFMVSVGDQILRTEIFAIKNGEALDADVSEWADEYQGYNLDELVQNVNSAVATVEEMQSDVTDLKEGLSSIDGHFASYDESINDLYVAIGGDSEIKSSKRVSTMIGTDGSTKSETSTMHFYKFHCEGATQITFTFGTTVAGTNTHYFNQITEDGTVLSHPLLMVEKGENKSVTRDILSGCTDVVISVWTDNVSCKASLNFGDNKIEKLSSDVSNLALDVNDLSSAFGGEKTLTPISTNTIIGTDGTQKSPQAGTLEFYQFSDVSIYDSVTFTFPTTNNGTSVHWFNQIDADGNVLSHSPLNTPIGDNKTNTVTLLDGCKTIKISAWVANGAWSNVFFAISKVIAKGGIYAKVSALGDSITYGYSSDGTVNKTYLKQIADNFVSGYQNLGVVSTPICPNSNYTGTENQNAFVYRYSQIASDADLIIVAGGTNDFGHNVPIGTPTDGNDKFEETFYGALNYLITNIVTEHPYARIVFITPFHRNGDDVANSKGAKLIDYVNAIKDKCSAYGIACVDGYSLSGINTITAFKNAIMADGLHPNQSGHNLIYKNLMPYFAMF